MTGFRISRAAVDDLDAIADYIILDNPARAVSFVEELAERFSDIAGRPLSFPDRSVLRPGLRSALHGRYLIFFRLDGGIVEILRIVHGSRDLHKLFEGES